MTEQALWRAEDILTATRGQTLQDQSWSANGVSIDSRTAQKNDLFIALRGPTNDGHDYVMQAGAAGCSAALVEYQPKQTPAGFPLILVENVQKSMESLGQYARKRTTARIIAVTGSVGKTSSKEMLRLVLGVVGKTYANEGSLNNHWGVPLSLSRLPDDANYGVFEIGMNHAGELGPLSRMVQPHVALITTIEPAHLEFFSGLEAIADAKAEIFEGVMSEGSVVLNHDNSQYARLAAAAKAKGIRNILCFGQDIKTHARFLDYTPTAQGGVVRATIMGQNVTYTLNVPGLHVAMNSLGVLLTAATAGADLETCAAALTHYNLPKGRGVAQQLASADGKFTLIDESYNASPAAVKAAIAVLGGMQPTSTAGRRIMVLGDMRELGDTSPDLHRELAEHIIQHNIDSVYCCGPMMRHLFDALPTTLQGRHTATSADLAAIMPDTIHDGDLITVKGSYSMNMVLVVAALKKYAENHSSNRRAS